MNRVIYQLAFRESAFFIIPVIVILLGYCLFQQTPLRHFDSVVLLLGLALGFPPAFAKLPHQQIRKHHHKNVRPSSRRPSYI